MNDYTELKSDLEEHCGRLGVLAVNALEAQATRIRLLESALLFCKSNAGNAEAVFRTARNTLEKP